MTESANARSAFHQGVPGLVASTSRRPIGGAVALAVLAFPLFVSGDLDNVSSGLDNVMTLWKVLSAVIIVNWYIHRLLSRRPTPAHILPIMLVMFGLLFSTVANSGSLGRYLIVWGGFFVVALLVEVTIRDRPFELLLALKIVLGTIAVANCLSVLLAPDGLWSTGTQGHWLLGHRNNFGAPLIAALVVAAACDLLGRRRLTISTLIIGVAAFLSVLMTWSASSVVAIGLTIVGVLLVSLTRTGLRHVSPYLQLGLYVTVSIGIVVFRVQEVASELIAGVLDRSADLTGRTRIWDIVFGMIWESPFLGRGVQLAENNGLTRYNPHFVHAHNGELDILMQGGLLTFIPFAAMILLVTQNAARWHESRLVQLLYLGLILVMIRAITGLFFSSYAVLLVFLLLNAQSLVEKEGTQEGRRIG